MSAWGKASCHRRRQTGSRSALSSVFPAELQGAQGCKIYWCSSPLHTGGCHCSWVYAWNDEGIVSISLIWNLSVTLREWSFTGFTEFGRLSLRRCLGLGIRVEQRWDVFLEEVKCFTVPMFIFTVKLLYYCLMSLKVDKDLSCVLKYPEHWEMAH